MSLLTTLRGGHCALQLTSHEAVVMLPHRGNLPEWHAAVEMPNGAVTPRLRGRNLDRELVDEAMRGVVEAVPRRVRYVTLVLSDACVKLTVVPIEAAAAVNRQTRSEIVRWALGDTLPFPVDEAHVDEQLFEGSSTRCLLVAAVHREVLREYEEAAAPLGAVVRVLPATLALGWEVGDDEDHQLLVYADEDAVGCAVSRAGAPLFTRTRPRRGVGDSVAAAVVETLDYAADRLGAASGSAALAGLAAGDDELEATLVARGWSLFPVSGGQGGAGSAAALSGALRAADVGS